MAGFAVDRRMGEGVIGSLQLRRAVLLALGLLVVYGAVVYRLVDLQVLRHSELDQEARRNREREMLRQPRRGDILDVRGTLLATSVPVRTVCADPVLIGDYQVPVARALAPLLGVSALDLQMRLLPRVRQDPESGKWWTNRYVVLARQVPVETWERIQETMSSLDVGRDPGQMSARERRALQQMRRFGVFADPMEDQLRWYPNRNLAAHVLGHMALREVTVDGQVLLERRGGDGIERTLDPQLAGVHGWRVIETDSRRREVVRLRDQDVEPRDGWNVVLTLDAAIQNMLEQALAEAMEQHRPKNISGLVIRPQTGAILALANLPGFDPNAPGEAPAEARRNVTITDHMEPGSTFKVVVVGGALNDGVVSLEDVFDCERGRFLFGGRILHDHHPFERLTVEGIVTKSSNIGAAKIGLRLGEQRLYEYIRAFGFGARTGIPLPGEMPGYVPPVNRWYKVSIAQIPMGHGLAVTRLQMAMAMAAIANGGVLMQPKLVERLEDRQGRIVAAYQPVVVRRVLREESARALVQALKTVPTPEGTAPRAAVPGYTVAGKTGTAQKAEGDRGYIPGKYVSSFIGFLPADRPEVVIAVTLDEPQRGYYGGQVAGPVFRKVAERVMQYLGVPPDQPESIQTELAGVPGPSSSERPVVNRSGNRLN
ncbi:MAG: penicillin-binding protein 2 [Verrucomicrobiota bacterium]|nr:penicillin-binding protein 2 [Limisphaera sp.]MDW8381700.1 penicillin-binding protein 2 [Verrucomicrobiota bacterium]